MKLQFLGTSGFHPTERRHTSCVLLPELGFAFDAGTSAFRITPRLQTPDLTLFISHAHLDHICGLTYLLVPLYLQTIQTCRVYAPPQVLIAIENHLFHESVFPVVPRLELLPLTSDTMEFPEGRLSCWPLHHPGGATGYRFDFANGQSLAYVCDTCAGDDSIEFLRNVDVLVHECCYPDRLSQWCVPTGHSHTSQVARLAVAANVGRLILTHVDPHLTCDDPLQVADAVRIFPETCVAEDLQEICW